MYRTYPPGLCGVGTGEEKGCREEKAGHYCYQSSPPPFATDAEIADGKEIISKSDCLACHKIEEKLVGPAYTLIAAKYPQNQNSLDTLTKKIITGGKGIWGPVPMAPHPAISQADANKMIKYILTLNAKNPATSSK